MGKFDIPFEAIENILTIQKYIVSYYFKSILILKGFLVSISLRKHQHYVFPQNISQMATLHMCFLGTYIMLKCIDKYYYK